MPLKALVSFKECQFPQKPSFIHRVLLLQFLHLRGKGLVLEYQFCGNGHEGHVGDRGLLSFCHFLGLLENIDVLGDAQFVTIVGENLRGEVDNVERIEIAAIQF